MKIGFDGKRATHNFRGLGNYSRGIIEGLYLYSPENELFLYTPNFSDKRAVDWIKDHSKVKIQQPQLFIGKNFPGIWRSFLLENQINADGIDIYHGLSHEIPKLTSKRKFKTVVTIHDLIFIRYPEFFPWIDRKVYAKKFQYAVDNADLVIAICEQTKKDIMHFLKVKEDKIKVHYQSCSPLFYKKESDEKILKIKSDFNLNRPYILNVGAFEERKNQKNIVKVFNKISNKFEIDLVLVGSGKKYLNEVKSQVSELKLTNRVHILNQFPFHSLPALYQGAEIFFFPSHFEGFGIPIVEALFSGVPVVTSLGSCFPESAGPQSEYVDPTSIESMVNGLSQVLMNQNRKNQMIVDGYQFAKEFTQENSTAKLLELYRTIN